MFWLGASALLFLALHHGLSGSPLRSAAVNVVGEKVFVGLFSVLSIVSYAWLVLSYHAIESPESRLPLWTVPSWIATLQLFLQPFAIYLIVAGLSTKNPGTAQLEDAVHEPSIVHGALTITRHPFLWGVAIMSIGHLASLPSPRNFILWGVLAEVALLGTLSIDAKRARKLGGAWRSFAHQTSNIPMLAFISGRQRLMWREIGWMRPSIAVVLASATFVYHDTLFGVSAAEAVLGSMLDLYRN